MSQTCARCHQMVQDDTQFCSHCGAALATPLTPASPRFLYGGFWRRAAAWLLDAIIMNGVTLVIVAPFLVVSGIFGATRSSMAALLLLLFLGLLILTLIGPWLYLALMESSSAQGSLGKMALGLRVTDLEGRRISFARASGRYWAKIITGFTFGIGLIMAGFTQRKQALHDMIAGCLVLRT